MKTPRLTLRQWQVFASIAQTGSTRAAGEAMGLSQSAASAALSELERLLGTPVFDRVGRQLLLNSTGRALLDRARALLDAAEQMEALVEQQRPAPGDVRLGASTTIGNHVLAGLLVGYWGDWFTGHAQPWSMRVVVDNTAAICTAVARFEIDVGLIEGPCGNPQLQALPWRCDEMPVVSSPALAAEMGAVAGAAVPLAVLARQVWLLREAGSGTRVVTDHHLLAHLHAFDRRMELGNSEAIKSAAAQGLGLACLSVHVVADWLDSGRLVRVATPWPALLRQWHIVLHRRKQLSPALRHFVAALQAGHAA